jgi:ATP-dependent Lon protease
MPFEPPSKESTSETDKKPVTTKERKPMEIPSSVHVRITPDNLKEYVGPPVYQKDRMYTHAPPPGVSTGLGYLGNGSGAVMPIEAMVTFFSHLVCFSFLLMYLL